VSESATMAVESAIIGTPALYCTTLVGHLPVIDELEKKYRLAFQFHPADSQQLLERVKSLMDLPERAQEWGKRRAKMLADKIDLTEWIVNLPSRI
jgi:predicted glycosyltransferase